MAAAPSTADIDIRDNGRQHVAYRGPPAKAPELTPGTIVTAADRSRVIESYIPMAVHAARRYSGRGEPLTDLVQVAILGLMKAVDRFDPSRGVPFASFAMPTILGEIKRHFRDTTWTVRVPRSAQELGTQIAIAREDMAHNLYRMPSTVEVAAKLHVSVRAVLAAQQSSYAYRPLSFDQPSGEGLRLGDSIGEVDARLEDAGDRETLRTCLAHLPAREQRVIRLRFFGGLTQLEIADDIGVSQMQVSRLLKRSLEHLRTAMLDEPADQTPS